MKYTTIITLALACGPSAIMAAPVPASQGPTPAALAVREQGSPLPQPSPQVSPQGSAAQGTKGQKSENEGLMDKIEKILKDILGGLRKRGVVEEVGEALKKTLDGSSKLLNGEKSGSQSSVSAQSSNPDAEAPHGASSQQPKKDDDGDDSSNSDSGSGIAKFLGGRSSSPLDPVTSAVGSAPGLTESSPSPLNVGGSQPSTSPSPSPSSTPSSLPSESNPSDGQGQGQGSQVPSSVSQLSPEQLEAIMDILTSGSGSQQQQQQQKKTPQIPGQDE